ncbi:MAG: enoyl-CoA hydratase-related protein [Myxococcota bacterium]|nr:enoyl-CoA hydratase-related protein [Myxococcota bacterium]
MEEPILVAEDAGVLRLTLNRPEKKNAFNAALWNGLRGALARAREDPAVGVVVIHGAGNDFSAGQDLTEMLSGGGDGPAQEHPFFLAMKELYAFDKPLLAAARGVGVGFGATCLFHCDIVYVGESVRLRLPFVSLGLVPEAASSYMLQAVIGYQRAAELFFTAEWIDAQRAVESGIAARVFPDDELLDATLEKAREIARWPVNSLQATKRTLRAPHQDAIWAAEKVEQAGMRAQVGSPENLEAISAFIEKRKPDFRRKAEKS